MYQQFPHGIDVLINIASLKNNGNPKTEDVIDFFRHKGLSIKHTVFDDSEKMTTFAYPSLTKNRQIAESDADWFMCHSCDHLIQSNYLFNVAALMNGKRKDTPYILGNYGNYFTVDIEKTNGLVEAKYSEGMYVDQAFGTTAQFLDLEKYLFPCIGGLLLFRHDMLRERNNNQYIEPSLCHDKHLFKKGMKTRSDVHLKKTLRCRVEHCLPFMIHLSHRRDKEIGYHIEEQR